MHTKDLELKLITLSLEIEIFQYLIKNTEPRIFRKNNHRDSDKNKLRTFEPRGGENFKNIELQRKKSGSYKKKCNIISFRWQLHNEKS